MQTITATITVFYRDFSQVYLNRKKLKEFKTERARFVVEFTVTSIKSLDINLIVYTTQELLTDSHLTQINRLG